VDISVIVCLLVFVILCLCTVIDFPNKDKASGVIFCTAIHRRPGQGISHYVELCFPRSPKSDGTNRSLAYPAGLGRLTSDRRTIYSSVSARAKRRARDATFVKLRGVWTQDPHVWIHGRPRRRTYLFFTSVCFSFYLIYLNCSKMSLLYLAIA